jgi:hypothetical protein
MRISTNENLIWKGDELYRTNGGKPLVKIVPDAAYAVLACGECACLTADCPTCSTIPGRGMQRAHTL